MTLPLLGAGLSAPGGGVTVANLDLNFAANLSLTPTVGPTPSFTRASTATFFNSTGVLTSAAINAPRFDYVYNGTSWVSKGLLVEEQRTNVCPRSQYPATGWQIFPSGSLNFTANFATAPDGTTAAARIYPNANGNFPTIYQNTTTTNNCTSVYAKYNGKAWMAFYNTAGSGPAIWFNIQTGTVGTSTGYTASIQNVGNGWYRCSAVPNTGTWAYHYVCLVDANGGTTVTASGTNGALIWGAQAETGTFPTSYIPTPSTTAIIRSADVCQITGSDFTSFWNASEGSFAVEYSLPSAALADRGLLNANDGSISKYITIYGQSGSGQPGKNTFIVINGTLQASIYAATVAANTLTKIAAAWKLNDFSNYSQGTAGTPDGTGTIPSPLTQLEIGKGYPSGAGDPIQIGHIARLRYYPSRLPDATLQLLSEPDPSLNLQFAINKTLTPVSGPTPSFSRASTGTFFNSSGVLTTAAINAPRFDHVYNGSSWVSKGLLIEEQRTNNLLQSNSFSTTWVSLDGAVVANSGTSPDGTNNAWKMNELATTTASHGIYQNLTIPGGACTWSIFAKAGERSWLQFIAYNSSTNFFTWFNLSNGTIGTNAAGNTATITPVGNGWYRCSITRSAGADYAQFYTANGDNNGSYLGEVGKGIYIFGAQIETGSFPTSYIPTTTAAVTRSADVCQITGTDFSGFWNASEGSFACEVNPFGGNTIANQGIVTANDGTFSNVLGQIRNLQNTNGDYGAFCRASGTTTMSTVRAAGSTQVGVTFRAATGFKANDCADSLNGGAVITDGTVTLPNVDRLTIGDFHTGANTILNGHIASLRYYPARLTNVKLQELST